MTASSCSTHPLVLPGVLTMMVSPRMPTIPRESRPSGLTAHRLGQAGCVAFDDRRAPSGVCLRRESGPARRHDEAGESLAQLDERCSDEICAVGGHPVVDDFESVGRQVVDQRPTAHVVAGSVHDTVADGEHLGERADGVGHGTRRYRISTMPSVSASCGSTRQPCSNGRQVPTGGSVGSTSKPSGVT